MTHVDGRTTGSAGGEIYWQAWLPDDVEATKVRGVVIVVHGYAEHSGRYAYVGQRLNDAGYAVYALDQRGHGQSDGIPGNVERYSHLRADISRLRTRAMTEHPHVPVFLLGHSLGGLIALDYVTSGGADGLAGVVLSGAAVDPSVGSLLEKAVAPVLSILTPNLGVSGLDPHLVSKDPEVVAAYVADPLNYHGKIRARSGWETLAAIDRVTDRLGNLTLPALVLHGAEDGLAAPAGSQLVADRIGSEDVTLTVYDGLFHEIFNEPERDAVLDDVVSWLDAHA